jgi:WD40-like Beta Propeller Repeat
LRVLTVCATVVVGVFAVLIAAGSALRERGAGTPPTGEIAFETPRGLDAVNAAGGQPRKIGGTEPGDGDPAWSPDGTRIAFDREQDHNGRVNDVNRDIYVMNEDGSDQRRLTFSRDDDGWPAWSPDGRSLVFESDRDGWSSAYAVVVASDSARRVASHAEFPDWMPNRLIVFTHNGAIETVRPYGADRQQIAQSLGAVFDVRASRRTQARLHETHSRREPLRGQR